MEVTSQCLEDYFRHIPKLKLSEHIEMRFKLFDRDHNGTLDREEVREAMAEMGQRPSELELDRFFAAYDKNSDQKISLVSSPPHLFFEISA